MLPVERNISIYRGDTYKMLVRVWTLTEDDNSGGPFDLTGTTVLAQIRSSVNDVMPQTTFVTATPTAGVVQLTLTSGQTALLTMPAVYDVQLHLPDGTVRTLVQGTIIINNDVSHD